MPTGYPHVRHRRSVRDTITARMYPETKDARDELLHRRSRNQVFIRHEEQVRERRAKEGSVNVYGVQSVEIKLGTKR